MCRLFGCLLFFSRGGADGGVDRCQPCLPFQWWKVLHAVTMEAWGPWAWRADSSVTIDTMGTWGRGCGVSVLLSP